MFARIVAGKKLCFECGGISTKKKKHVQRFLARFQQGKFRTKLLNYSTKTELCKLVYSYNF